MNPRRPPGGTDELLAVSVVTPTRNEAHNVEEFVARACGALADEPYSWEIVFADDSDDQTPKLIAKLSEEGLPVRYVHREIGDRKGSISGAIHAAIPAISSDVVVVIDCDMQHPPEILPSMIRPILSGEVELTLGTRYAAGGSAEGLETAWRRWASRSAGLTIAAFFPQFRRCSDLATGLFAFRLDDFNTGQCPPTGFKVLVEVLVRCDPRRIGEIPYVFEPRFNGLSKARVRDGFRLVIALARARVSLLRPSAVPVVHPGVVGMSASDALANQ